MAEEKGLTVIDEAKRKFELACKDASALQDCKQLRRGIYCRKRNCPFARSSFRRSNGACIYAAYEHEGRLSYRP